MNWVFDLDNTIYNTDNLNYSNISNDNYLKCLLNNLEGEKYIFTNATLGHAEIVLNRLGILDIFDNIIDRTEMKTLKPHRAAFNYFINNTTLNRNRETVFFEDTLENLITAKREFGWITVLILPQTSSISRTSQTSEYIDYIYRDIHTAIENFSFNPGQCYTHKINY